MRKSILFLAVLWFPVFGQTPESKTAAQAFKNIT